MRRASPSDWAKPLIAGLGPMKLASMASANSASMASVPELNVTSSRLTPGPSASAKMPSSTPMMAGAWVTFGKYARRSVTGSEAVPPAVLAPPVSPAVSLAGRRVVVVAAGRQGAQGRDGGHSDETIPG